MSQQITSARDLDLASPVFKTNPYPALARLRIAAPVSLLNAQEQGPQTWLITRYQEAELVLRDERFVKDRANALPSQREERPPSAADLMCLGMVDFDPPDHTRLRALVGHFFTPRAIESWQARVQQITDELIDAVIDQGRMDVIEALAFPLPLNVISEILGIPAADRPALHSWTRQMADAFDHPGTIKRADEPLHAFYTYLPTLIEQKRRQPANDLVSELVQAADRISEREIMAMIFLLIVAGHDTTDNLIGNGLYALLTHPEQLALLRREPARIKVAVEEFLRYYSPFMLATRRWAREEMALCGQLIRRGDQMAIALISANRDESRFSGPDQLDITRLDNHHLAFGKGIHYCLGAPLARLEGQIALSTLLRRLPQLRLQGDPGELVWRPGSLIIGLSHLPVVF
ncbi:MAG TPA: cytochrome P450 [Ktedonobacteraceae bacterium]|jgi:cytochrome P450